MSRPFRYTFILVLVALGTCLAAVSGWRYARASAPVSGPIVLISIDSLRTDHLPAYGYHRIKTPAIDTLAADGLVFERAYSHVPQTLPAHAALLTGRLPFETGVRDAVGFSVPAGARLLPEMLRDRGFATAGVVSSFLLRKETGIGQGFAFFDDAMPASESSESLRRDASDSERVAERWLDSSGTPRAFLFLHLNGPRGSRGADRASAIASYDSAIVSVDVIVGRLVRYLKTHQLYDQSTVILVSGHGEGLGDHGEQGHGLFVYDESVHVPLIIKPPAGEGAGRRIKSVVQHADLVPTVLDLAKAPIPGNLRGRSLTPLFSSNGSVADAVVYSESLFAQYHFGWSGLASLTDGRYRFIDAPTEELYDLEADPHQLKNIAAARAELSATFRAKLTDLVSSEEPVLARDAVSEEDRRRYAAFGYVGEPAELSPPSTATVDPKDKSEVVDQYRAAVDFLVAENSKAAIDQLLTLTLSEPYMRDVWMLLATTAADSDRAEVAVDAYQHAIALAPARLDAYLGAATSLLQLRKLDDARLRAQSVVDAAMADGDSLALAHELLARIALARRNFDLARSEAALAEEDDAARPVGAYVAGRIAFDRRRYADAFEAFDAALTRLGKPPARPLADLRLYAAESLFRLERFPEAESLFLEELKASPENRRARAGLSAVYTTTGRPTEAAALAHQ